MIKSAAQQPHLRTFWTHYQAGKVTGQDDEYSDRHLERKARLRRGSVWLMSLIMIGMLIGLMIGRVVKPVNAPEQPSVVRVLDVSAQTVSGRLHLTLLLDGTPKRYDRIEQGGAVSVTFGPAALGDEAQGVVEGAQRFSWRVSRYGDAVQVLLVPLSGALEVVDAVEPGDAQGWRLQIVAAAPGAADA